MTKKRNIAISHRTKSYLTAFFTGLPFFLGITYLGVYLAQRGVFFSFLSWLFLIALPLSPLLVVSMYFIYRALVPVTGGMPAKGFRQWMLAYAWAVALLLYWALLGVVFDMVFPSIDRDYREAILPLFIVALTQILLAKSARFKRFVDRAFQMETTKGETKEAREL